MNTDVYAHTEAHDLLMRSKSNLKLIIGISAAAFIICAAVLTYMLCFQHVFDSEQPFKALFWPAVLMIAALMIHIMIVIRSKSEILVYTCGIAGKGSVHGHPLRLRPFDVPYKEIDSLAVSYRHIIFETGGINYSVLCASNYQAQELHLAIFQLTENAKPFGL